MKRSIEASKPVSVAYAAACDDPAAVFSDTDEHSERRVGRVLTDLGVEFDTGVSVHQMVAVQMGDATSSAAELVLPVRWKAVTRARLLPAFDGELDIADDGIGTRLMLSGVYSVPFGVIGRLVDRVVGRRLIRRSLEALVDGIGRRLVAEVDRRRQQAMPRLRSAVGEGDGEHSETFIG